MGLLRLKQTDEGELELPIVLVDGVESVKAAIYNILSTQAQDQQQHTSDGIPKVIQGEWAFDKSHGVRWRGQVLRRYFSEGDTKAIIAGAINKVPEVQEVTASQITLTFDNEQRRVDIVVSNVRLTSGETVPELSVSTAI